jgi:serine protease AprX
LPYVTSFSDVGRVLSPVDNKFELEMLKGNNEPLNSIGRTASFNYGSSFDQISMLNGHIMHDNGYTGDGLVIAVLDAGFLHTNTMVAFDSLRNSNKILSTFDFVDPGSSVYDDAAHGSMVLSVMASNVPGEIIGAAPHASYHLLRSEDTGTETLIEEYNWASAAEYADSAGVDIINSSLGYTEFDDPAQNHTYADLDGNTTPITIAADWAASKGMIVVNSAGNNGTSSWFRISAPADADSILGVGAVDVLSVYADFSGKGPSYDGRVKPDVSAMGSQTIVADPWTGSGTFPGNGTSFSAPLIAGFAACLWQCNPNKNNIQIINALKQSSSQYNNPDSLVGHGIPDVPLACLILGGIDPGITELGDQLIVEGNPFTGFLSFSVYTNNNQDAIIRLVDALGKVIIEKNEVLKGISLNKFEYNTTLATGVYTLEVITENSHLSSKVVRQ